LSAIGEVKYMPLRHAARRTLPVALAIALAGGLAACSGMGSGLSLTSSRTQGYDISDDALSQIRPGQSQQLVQLVLGSPQTTNAFGDGTAWYYVETKVDETAFGMSMIKSRTVLAVYYDKNKRVSDRVVYGLQDGRVINMDTRRTPSYGEDRTFIESILTSVMSSGGSG
jgi:outer membrane protein assembly factor BamE (lipoprotein component of BamABCDE complex)